MNNIPVKLYNASEGCKNNVLINCTPIGVNENTELQILDFIDKTKYCIDINYINNKYIFTIFIIIIRIFNTIIRLSNI